jgi:hypothetical protein
MQPKYSIVHHRVSRIFGIDNPPTAEGVLYLPASEGAGWAHRCLKTLWHKLLGNTAFIGKTRVDITHGLIIS